MGLLIKGKEWNSPILQEGLYSATLNRVTQFRNAHEERIGFEFSLQQEGGNAIRVFHSTTAKLTPNSRLTAFVIGILGRELTPNEVCQGIDLEKLVGARCRVLLFQQKNNAGEVVNKIENVFSFGAMDCQ